MTSPPPSRDSLSDDPFDPVRFRRDLHRIDLPWRLLRRGGTFGLAPGAVSSERSGGNPPTGAEFLCDLPALPPRFLGDASFLADVGIRQPYIAGAMANGIASVEIVEAMGRAGMLGFFGAAGLPVEKVTEAMDRLEAAVSRSPFPYGFNLIHSPSEPDLEAAVVELYLRRGIRLVSASAYLRLTLPLLRYRFAGIRRAASGEIVVPNRVIGKVSRVEIARRFFSPPPEKLLRELVANGDLTEEQARLAESVPVAQEITAEADSGGHTDNQPFLALLPTMLALRDEMQSEHGFAFPLRVGAAGGIGTPAAACAAFAMGAAYILTGSVNQACVEAGTSDRVRKMLAETRQADVSMAPAADMFEMGVKVQVLKRGTMFAMRAAKLYEIWRACAGPDDLPADQRAMLEKDYFRAPIDEVWAGTRAFFEKRDPRQIEKAERDPKHRLALLFRAYLGQTSRWANAGVEDRQVDYQIWCGPAMGAFNEWCRGSFLDDPAERKVVTVALNLLHGAAVLTRVHTLRARGLALSPECSRIEPKRPEALGWMLPE